MGEHKHITKPDPKGYQVRIVRNKKEHSRFFPYGLWGSGGKALAAAISWRDQMLIVLGRSNSYTIRKRILANKKSTGVRGVTRTIQYDQRRDTYCLVYGVHYKKDGKAANKTFHVGRVGDISADEELHAFRTAVRFRREFEISKIERVEFHPSTFTRWRHIRIYDNIFCEAEPAITPRQRHELKALQPSLQLYLIEKLKR